MSRRPCALLICLLAACGFDRSGVSLGDDELAVDASPGADPDGGSTVIPPDAAPVAIDAPACGSDPTPPGDPACPAECTGGCQGAVCSIDCSGQETCRGDLLRCPDGFSCAITCAGDRACDGATIECPATYECAIECSGPEGCRGIDVNCGAGTCTLACGSGDAVCSSGARLDCGAGACTATCTGGGGGLFGGGGGRR
jgi:hypothetical protein